MKTDILLASLLSHTGLTSHIAAPAGAAAGLIDEKLYLDSLGKDINLYDRMWEEYALWYLIAVGVICLGLCVAGLMLFLKRRKAINADPTEPWDMKTAYRKWGIGGLIGLHRYYLGSWCGLFYPLLISALIVVIAIDVMPNFYGILPPDQIYISILAWSVVRVIAGFWLFDAFWIRYRCYSQPYIILRKQERMLVKKEEAERLISKKDANRHEQFATGINATLTKLKTQAESEYDGTRNGFLRGVGNLFRSKDPWVEFEEKRLEEIVRLYSAGSTTYEEYLDFLARLKNKTFNKLSQRLNRDVAIAGALEAVVEQAESQIAKAASAAFITPTITFEVCPTHHTDYFDAALIQRERPIAWPPLRPTVSCGPKEMERIAKAEGRKAVETVAELARIINTPLNDAVADMVLRLEYHKKFLTAYYIPLRNLLFACKPTFWDFITHKPIETGPFMEICNSSAKSVTLPAAQNKISPKAKQLAEDMHIFMQEYSDAILSLV